MTGSTPSVLENGGNMVFLCHKIEPPGFPRPILPIFLGNQIEFLHSNTLIDPPSQIVPRFILGSETDLSRWDAHSDRLPLREVDPTAKMACFYWDISANAGMTILRPSSQK
jgi:hypothetical protein